MTKLSQNVLQQLYHDEGKSIRAIAETLHVAPRTVYDAMIHWRIPRRASRGVQRTMAHQQLFDERTLRRLYLDDQQSIRAIAQRLNVSVRAVTSALLRWNIPRRHTEVRSIAAHGRGLVGSRFDEATLRSLYLEAGHTIAELANVFNVSPSTIRNALRYCEIPCRRKGRRTGAC